MYALIIVIGMLSPATGSVVPVGASLLKLLENLKM
jgi:hypothetical protein